MKIYARTLLFFLGAITFQALLTAGLIVGLVSRNNQSVTRTELHEESVLVYENYNTWVRSMWKEAIGVRDDAELVELASSAADWSGNVRMRNHLEWALHKTGIDSFIIRHQGWDHFEILSDAYPYIDDFSPFVMDRNHPYIALKSIEGYVFLVASINLTPETRIYLLKHIDDDFYNQLKTRDHTRVFISNDSAAMWNAVGIGEDRSADLDLEDPYPPYREIYDINFGRGHYNVSMQNMGHLENNGELKLLVFMSTEPYFSLLVRIGRIVLVVSLVTAILMAVFALLFTGRLTTPIHSLVTATEKIRDGDLTIAVTEDAMGEIRTLLEGFNSMVRHLNENQVTLDSNLREITFLNEYNETIIHSLRAGILVVNNEMVIEKSNSFYRECFPYSRGNPEGLRVEDLESSILDEDVRSAVEEIVAGEIQPWSKIKRQGDYVWELKVYPLGGRDEAGEGRCVIEMDDVSAKMELEQKILQAEKLSSLSLLSAGIAHEINNPLSTILSNAQMLLQKSKNGVEKDALSWIEKETRRIADIVRELRDFSHSGDDSTAEHDINECVEEVVRLIRYGMPSDGGVRIDQHLHAAPLYVAMPKEELRQVVLNILQNAVQAVNGSGSNELETIEYDTSRHGILIRDTGEGIPEEIMNRIFDPFFTTKRGGVGTGLGLSIVYGIIKKFGGDIEVKSENRMGTLFTLILPKKVAS